MILDVKLLSIAKSAANNTLCYSYSIAKSAAKVLFQCNVIIKQIVQASRSSKMLLLLCLE